MHHEYKARHPHNKNRIIKSILSNNRLNHDIECSFNYTENLNHYQMTNFRFFQTERVCRQQFQI